MAMRFFCFVNFFWSMVLLVAVNNACAMEIVQYTDSPDKFVREFPLMSLKRAHWRYNQCNGIDAQKEIDQKIIKEGPCLFSIFYMATKLPFDCSRKIVKKIVDVNNEKVIEQLLESPICKTLEECSRKLRWIEGVYQGFEAKNFIASMSSSLKSKYYKQGCYSTGKTPMRKFLWRYCNEIKTVNEFILVQDPTNRIFFRERSRERSVDRNVLEAFDKLNKGVKKFFIEEGSTDKALDIYNDTLCYKYYDTYTWVNFFNEFKKCDLEMAGCAFFVVPIVTSWLSRYIELNCCQEKILTEADVQFNSEILQYLDFKSAKSLIEEGYHSYLDRFKMKLPFFAASSFILSCLAIDSYQKKELRSFNGEDVIVFVFDNFIIGSFLMALSCLRSDDFPLGFWGVLSSVSAGFLVLAIIRTVINMRSIHNGSVRLEGLSQVLTKNRDGHIVIE